MSESYATPSAAIAAMNLSPEAEAEELKCFVYDFYKYANGIRPRWMCLWGEGSERWTVESLREEADIVGRQYQDACKREEEEEREREAARERAARERVREANERALAKRRFDRAFNSLAHALAHA